MIDRSTTHGELAPSASAKLFALFDAAAELESHVEVSDTAMPGAWNVLRVWAGARALPVVTNVIDSANVIGSANYAWQLETATVTLGLAHRIEVYRRVEAS